MFDQKKLTVPANTQQTSPASVEFSLTPGMLERVWVHFPDGCNQLVHIVIYHGGTQLVPREMKDSISGNDFTYELTQACEIKQGYGKLVARGWSPGTFYPHNILIAFDTFSIEERDLTENFLEGILATLKGIGKVLGVK